MVAVYFLPSKALINWTWVGIAGLQLAEFPAILQHLVEEIVVLEQ